MPHIYYFCSSGKLLLQSMLPAKYRSANLFCELLIYLSLHELLFICILYSDPLSIFTQCSSMLMLSMHHCTHCVYPLVICWKVVSWFGAFRISGDVCAKNLLETLVVSSRQIGGPTHTQRQVTNCLHVHLEFVFRLQMTKCTWVINAHAINAPLHTCIVTTPFSLIER